MRWSTALIPIFILAGWVNYASAHTIRPAVATIVVDDSGTIDIRIRTNAEAMLADIGPEHSDTDDSPNAGRYNKLRSMGPNLLAEKFAEFAPVLVSMPIVWADDQPLTLGYSGIEIPPVGDVELARDSTLLMQGSIPPGATAITWAWPADYGSSVVRFSRSDDPAIQSQWLKSGEVSDAFVPGADYAPPSRLDVALNYLVIGFEHIVPKGLDHILFVVGIFLLSVHLKPLLLQVTAFTVAHTITLGLSIYGIVSAPSSIVEPLIALSIAYVGIENCLSSRLKPWRVVLVFLFGLLHGMGFAGVLGEVGLPRSEFLTALIAFNIGVEFGQLAVITVCLALFGWCSSRSWYRKVVVIPISVLISLVGLYWVWERTLA